MKYAELDHAGRVKAIVNAEIENGISIPDGVDPLSVLGCLYADGVFVAPLPPAARPNLVVTGIRADDAHMEKTVVSQPIDDVTCPVGTVLTVTAELRSPADVSVIPLSGNFRMPLRARDGREEVLLASMMCGLVKIVVPMDQSGVWKVTEQTINEGLPETMHMAFAGLTLFVFK